jgi:hypothetical protein
MLQWGRDSKYEVLMLLCIFCLVSYTKAQEGKKKIFLEVRVIDAYSSAPIVFANVINPKRDWWAISDTAGFVKIPSYPGDTITISSIGYGLIKFKITDSLLNLNEPHTVAMSARVYEISRVEIFTLGTYEDFKYRLLHMKIEDKLVNVKNRLRLDKAKISRYPQNENITIPLGSPITALFNLFSKEGKSKRKLAVALEQENLIRYAEIKYSSSLVESVTGLKNEKLDEFILKYRPPLDYLLNATEYEVIGRIMQDFEKFKKDTIK